MHVAFAPAFVQARKKGERLQHLAPRAFKCSLRSCPKTLEAAAAARKAAANPKVLRSGTSIRSPIARALRSNAGGAARYGVFKITAKQLVAQHVLRNWAHPREICGHRKHMRTVQRESSAPCQPQGSQEPRPGTELLSDCGPLAQGSSGANDDAEELSVVLNTCCGKPRGG
jgi:hypothetical protein